MENQDPMFTPQNPFTESVTPGTISITKALPPILGVILLLCHMSLLGKGKAVGTGKSSDSLSVTELGTETRSPDSQHTLP